MEFIKINEQNHSQVALIYAEGIATGNATFQTEAVDWETWDKNHLTHCRIAVLSDNKIQGWAALSPVSSRCVYGGIAEVSVYVADKARGKV